LQQAQTISILVGAGVKTIAEARTELGLGRGAGVAKYNHYHDKRGRFTDAEHAVEPGAHEPKKPDRGVEVAENESGPTSDVGGREQVAIGTPMEPVEMPPEPPKVEPAKPVEPAPEAKPDAPAQAWTPPLEALEKIPPDWGPPIPNRDGRGLRWFDPRGRNFGGIRIDQGDPSNPFPSQREDHVIVRSGGNVLGRDGEPISGSIQEDAENAHIPLSVWLTWKSWNHP
jgi:hypothetical protein